MQHTETNFAFESTLIRQSRLLYQHMWLGYESPMTLASGPSSAYTRSRLKADRSRKKTQRKEDKVTFRFVGFARVHCTHIK